jgi:hypothetical protein
MRSLIREIRKEKQLLLILSSWFIAGLLLPVAGYLFVPLSFLFFLKKRQFANIFVGLLFLFILSDSRLNGFNFAITTKPFVITIVAVFIYMNRHRLKFRVNHSFFSDFIPFFLFALIGIFFSPITMSSTSRTLSYIVLIWVGPLLFDISWKVNQYVILRKIFISVLLLLFSGIIIHSVNPTITSLASRYRGWFGNPNGLGIFIALWFFCAFTIHKQYPKLFQTNKLWNYMYLLTIISALMCSSRTTMVAIVIFLVFYKFKIRFITGIIITSICIILMQLILNNIEMIVISLNLEDYARLESLKDAGGRTVGLDYGWEEVKTDWYILGKGFGYTLYFYTSIHEELSMLNHVGSAHNSYLTAWLDTGLVGLVFFLFAWGKQLNKFKINRICYPLFFSCLFSSFLESWLVGSLNPYTIVFMLTLLILQKTKNDSTELKMVILQK